MQNPFGNTSSTNNQSGIYGQTNNSSNIVNVGSNTALNNPSPFGNTTGPFGGGNSSPFGMGNNNIGNILNNSGNNTGNPNNNTSAPFGYNSGNPLVDSIPSVPSDINRILADLRACYYPSSGAYKFQYTFYNLSPTPISRPSHFSPGTWRELYINDYLMPVVLNKEQIEERQQKQNNLIMQLNNSKYSMIQSLEVLKNKRTVIESKLKSLIGKFRYIGKQYINNNSNINGSNAVEVEFSLRDKLYLKDPEEGKRVMGEIKKKLLERIEKVREEIKEMDHFGIKNSMTE